MQVFFPDASNECWHEYHLIIQLLLFHVPQLNCFGSIIRWLHWSAINISKKIIVQNIILRKCILHGYTIRLSTILSITIHKWVYLNIREWNISTGSILSVCTLLLSFLYKSSKRSNHGQFVTLFAVSFRLGMTMSEFVWDDMSAFDVAIQVVMTLVRITARWDAVAQTPLQNCQWFMA